MQPSQQTARIGLALPQPKGISEVGFELAEITGKTSASIMRRTANKWFKEKMSHMLSPKEKTEWNGCKDWLQSDEQKPNEGQLFVQQRHPSLQGLNAINVKLLYYFWS